MLTQCSGLMVVLPISELPQLFPFLSLRVGPHLVCPSHLQVLLTYLHLSDTTMASWQPFILSPHGSFKPTFWGNIYKALRTMSGTLQQAVFVK
jgi:hypothetical protein